MGIAPLVSIIIVTFNADKTLRTAIDSVLKQSTEETELIIIDGQSTDGTLPIIKSYGSKINKWISEPDAGIYDAMNKGIGLACGDYLYFLGADDELLDVIPKISPILRNGKNGKNIYYGDVILKNAKNTLRGGAFNKLKLLKCNIPHQGIFYPKNLLENKNYDLRYKLLSDYHLNISLFGDRSINWHYIKTPIAIYAITGASSAAKDKNFSRDKPELIRQHFGYFWYAAYRTIRSLKKLYQHEQ
ncbi:glycosyltransferase family 2 protein [Thauera phenylacetica]